MKLATIIRITTPLELNNPANGMDFPANVARELSTVSIVPAKNSTAKTIPNKNIRIVSGLLKFIFAIKWKYRITIFKYYCLLLTNQLLIYY